MKRPGPTPDTMVETIVYDNATYLVTYRDDEPISIAYRMMRNGRFYAWKPTWKEGSPVTPRDAAILSVGSS